MERLIWSNSDQARHLLQVASCFRQQLADVGSSQDQSPQLSPCLCMPPDAGVLRAQPAAMAGHDCQPGVQLQLCVGSKQPTALEAADACGPGCELMHARAGAPVTACELLLAQPDSAVQALSAAQHAGVEQPKSPARQADIAPQLQLPQGPGSTAAALPASPLRLALRGDRSRSTARSPARRRGPAAGSQQPRPQQHMLKLKDFPPAAEFSRLMARHNQVRRTCTCRLSSQWHKAEFVLTSGSSAHTCLQPIPGLQNHETQMHSCVLPAAGIQPGQVDFR